MDASEAVSSPYKAWPEKDNTWIHGRMDGLVDGREGDKRENEGRGKRQVKPIRPPTTKQNKFWRW